VLSLVKSEIVVKTILRLVLWLLMGGVALAAILAALAGYFLYTPIPSSRDCPALLPLAALSSTGESERTRPMCLKD
jgi:hypothetical protein